MEGITRIGPEPFSHDPQLHEMEEAIGSMKNNKAPGEDAITAEMIKTGGPALLSALHSLIVQIWREEEMPEDWHTANKRALEEGFNQLEIGSQNTGLTINANKTKYMFNSRIDGQENERQLVMGNSIFERVDEFKYLGAMITHRNEVQNHLSPKPNPLTERYRFKERKQDVHKSIAAYVVALKKISSTCDFGANLDNSLRDQFVWGIHDKNIKKKLLTENDLTFAKAVEFSTSMEMTNHDVMQYGAQQPTTSATSEVQYVNKHSTSEGGGWQKNKNKVKCFFCGLNGHFKSQCYHKDKTCRRCNKVGHLEKVCKNDNSGKEKSVKYIKGSNFNLFALYNELIEFQVDTGSALTVISKSDYSKFKISRELLPTDLSCRGYTGSLSS
ncbi:uncharacterized protein LOC120354572 [Nilaparvata lugens]|uniref:uncharacterized protein LOC120354572 n=1 Tax=Nilaparvata lugens TaxID=108931 RepID=UPI00193C9F8B|nr:uncharacterized protein LOC120354572 [Nilaparvata lugens]